jgi:DNA-binding beta-propeller fold protein YncE
MKLMSKGIGIIILLTLVIVQPSCSGQKLGGLVESSVSPSQRLKVAGFSYQKSLQVLFPSVVDKSRPSSVVVLPGGELAIVDKSAGVAGLFGQSGVFISYLEAPSTFRPSLEAPGPGLSLYLLDAYSSEIYRFDSTGNLAGLADFADEPALFAGFCFDKTGRAYLSDQERDEIVVIDPSGGTERRLGGFGSERGMFIDPAGIAVDERGMLYVCDRGNSRVQVLDGWGGVLRVWALNGSGCVPRPEAIVVDRWGNSFVTDQGCSCLRVLNDEGTETARLQGKGPGLAFLDRPEGLDLDAGRLLAADPVEGGIQIFEIQYEAYH